VHVVLSAIRRRWLQSCFFVRIIFSLRISIKLKSIHCNWDPFILPEAALPDNWGDDPWSEFPGFWRVREALVKVIKHRKWLKAA
jgi:hypothetical protein